jgi:hypothetical protein
MQGGPAAAAQQHNTLAEQRSGESARRKKNGAMESGRPGSSQAGATSRTSPAATVPQIHGRQTHQNPATGTRPTTCTGKNRGGGRRPQEHKSGLFSREKTYLKFLSGNNHTSPMCPLSHNRPPWPPVMGRKEAEIWIGGRKRGQWREERGEGSGYPPRQCGTAGTRASKRPTCRDKERTHARQVASAERQTTTLTALVDFVGLISGASCQSSVTVFLPDRQGISFLCFLLVPAENCTHYITLC